MVCQEVVDIEAGAADRWFEVEAGVGSMPVVLVNPGSEVAQTFGRVLIEASVGPLANGGLDEAFGFTVGARGVEASALGLDMEGMADGEKGMGTETGTVVGEHAADANAEAGEVGNGLAQESAGGNGLFSGSRAVKAMRE